MIELGSWADDSVGFYDYTSEAGDFVLEYELRQDHGEIAIILLNLNGSPASFNLPSTQMVNGEVRLFSAGSRPEIVPQALLIVIVWTEALSKGAF